MSSSSFSFSQVQFGAATAGGLVAALVILLTAIFFTDALRGEKGDCGEDGRRGNDGEDGRDGEDGDCGDHGMHGTQWFINHGPPESCAPHKHVCEGDIYVDASNSNLYQRLERWHFRFNIGVPEIIPNHHTALCQWSFTTIVNLRTDAPSSLLGAYNPLLARTDYIRFPTSTTNILINGINGGVDGRQIVLYNPNATVITIIDTNAVLPADNVELSGLFGQVVTPAQPGSITLRYDGILSSWHIESSSYVLVYS